MAKDEPQSYGSQSDSTTGKVGETVNRQKGTPSDAEQPVQKVTDRKSGAKRGGFFKDRDYER